ncbi:transcriptional regulator of sugar metabolism [Sphaerochaeta pleomorpha str. Grapes]|uniref:Transcriptional regulator of sugar metabolism n=1 Tax=Sphaerochaeta pleomorpha (strain ATCC BAA-1885 / DSM 22778 / Grapes) TaxID=158190 RepID=G8QVC3_SPHPG|nr:DeoR/GlpR family DNA-binding transcription regulator [Sphaerochaeta pleomorpha]AEV30438.1 transcriptional regulator of sugar metabolism [Sphaerochaeta pleomorpha str. Grapes]
MKNRRNQIEEFINENGAVSFSLLKTAFPTVSEMTLRNDLKALDEMRLIVRVHGGAKSVDRIIGTDDLLNKRFCRNVEKKRCIAEKAANLIYPSTSIFLDSGSTVTELARKFPDEPHLVFTSGIHCAIELAKLSKVQIFMPGGKINPSSMSISGSDSCEKIREMNYDIAFLGTTGYMKTTGFNCGALEESSLKRAVISRAETTVLLMDSSKVEISNTFSFANVQDIDILISDDELDPQIAEYFRNNNIKVL